MFAVVRLKGQINLREELDRTLKMLRLYKRNSCVLIPATPALIGMLGKVEHVITWGEPSAEVIAELLKKRGKLPGNKKLTEEYLREKVNKDFNGFAAELVNSKMKIIDVPGLKQVFRLKPPFKGLEAAGLKKPYSLGGSFGYRGKNITDLLKRMI